MADTNSVVGFSENSSSIGDTKTNPNLMDPSELEKMVADSLKDDSSEDDGDDLESDKELMRQLKEITEGPLIVTNNQDADQILTNSALITADVLKQRIEMYKFAEANAKANGQDAKVRRLCRGLTRLNDLLRQTNAGEQIVADDIPPKVTTKPSEGNCVTTVDEQSPGSATSADNA